MKKKISIILILVLSTLLIGAIVFIIVLMNERIPTPVSEKLDKIEAIMLRQPEKLDSLIQEIDTLKASEHDMARLNLIRGYNYYNDFELVKSIKLIEHADNFFFKDKDNYYINLSSLIKAFNLEQLHLRDEAADAYRKCDIYFEENNLYDLRFYSLLGMLRSAKQLNLDKEIFLKEIHALPLETNKPYYQGLIHSALANIAYLEGDKEKRAELLEKVAGFFNAAGDKRNLLINSMTRLSILIRDASIDEAEEYYHVILGHTDTTQLNIYQRSRLRLKYSNILYKRGNYKQALSLAKESLKDAKNIGVTNLQMSCYAVLHLIYLNIEDYKKSLENYRRYYFYYKKQAGDLQQARMLALGASYRFERLEQERLLLKSRFEKSVWLVLFIIVLFILMVYWYQNHLKKSKIREANLIRKNEIIGEQLNELLVSLEQQEEENSELISQIKVAKQHYHDNKELREFLQTVNDEDNTMTWMDYEVRFNDHRPGWIHRLEAKVPGLTSTDIRYCMCFYFNLNNAVTGKLCGVSIDAVKSAKKRIRDKFQLNDSKEIYLFLKEID